MAHFFRSFLLRASATDMTSSDDEHEFLIRSLSSAMAIALWMMELDTAAGLPRCGVASSGFARSRSALLNSKGRNHLLYLTCYLYVVYTKTTLCVSFNRRIINFFADSRKLCPSSLYLIASISLCERKFVLCSEVVISYVIEEQHAVSNSRKPG